MKEPSAELIIDIDVIRNNIIYLKSLLNPNSKFMAVLKANAYGHGLQKIADGINDIVDGFGLVRIEEALNVRKFSSKKILLMQGLYNKEDLDLAIKNLPQEMKNYKSINKIEEEVLTWIQDLKN